MQRYFPTALFIACVLSLSAQDVTDAYFLIAKGDSLRKLMQLEAADAAYLSAAQQLETQTDWNGYFQAQGHRVRILIQQQSFDQATKLLETLRKA